MSKWREAAAVWAVAVAAGLTVYLAASYLERQRPPGDVGRGGTGEVGTGAPREPGTSGPREKAVREEPVKALKEERSR